MQRESEPSSSSSSDCVTLIEWWLLKFDPDSNGRRLAVGGFTLERECQTRVFTSAPIIKRHDAFTLETADGFTVLIQGAINRNRTINNGFPPGVTRCFSIGFPCNWDQYADENFVSNISRRSLGFDEKLQYPSSAEGCKFTVRLAELLRSLTFGADIWKGGNSMSNIAITRSSTEACSSLVQSGPLPVVSQPVATSESLEKSVGHSNVTSPDIVGNVTAHMEEIRCSRNDADGVHGESSVDNSGVKTLLNVTGGIQSEPSIPEETVVEKDSNAARLIVAKFDPGFKLASDKVGERYKKCTASSEELIVEDAQHGLLAKNHLSLSRCNQLENNAEECQNHAEKTELLGLSASEDLSLRKDCIGNDSDALTGKVSLSLEAPFRSPPPAAATRNAYNENTPNSAGSTCNFGLAGSSRNASSLLYLKYRKRLGDHALSSQNRAQRIRVCSTGDSKVSQARTNRNEPNSLTVITKLAHQTELRSPPNMERNLNDTRTIDSADFAVERVSNNLVSMERNVAHHESEVRRGAYALRSRSHAAKTGVERTGVLKDFSTEIDTKRNKVDSLAADLVISLHASPKGKKRKLDFSQIMNLADSSAERVVNSSLPTKGNPSNKLGSRPSGYALRSRGHVESIATKTAGVSDSSLGGKVSKEKDASSFRVERSVSFEPLIDLDARKLCTSPSRKGKCYRSRLEGENERISITMEQNHAAALGVLEQSGQKHAQSLGNAQDIESNPFSCPEEQTSSKHYCTIPATPDVNKRKRVNHSENDVSLQRSIKDDTSKDAIHLKSSHSENASDIATKRIKEFPDNQYESPLARDKAVKLPVTSLELLNLKRSRSGRLLVPPLDKGRQSIIYDLDGSITGITSI